MTTPTSVLIHGTTVAIAGRGVLIRGPSGSGKSDLALRLIDGGAVLVSDDQTVLERSAEGLLASAPATIAGLIEARGVGLLRLPHLDRVPLALVVDLTVTEGERLPEPSTVDLMGFSFSRIDIVARHASASAKVRLAVLSPTRDIMAAP